MSIILKYSSDEIAGMLNMASNDKFTISRNGLEGMVCDIDGTPITADEFIAILDSLYPSYKKEKLNNEQTNTKN